MERVQRAEVLDDQVEKLLDIMANKLADQTKKFYICLKRTNQIHVAGLLGYSKLFLKTYYVYNFLIKA